MDSGRYSPWSCHGVSARSRCFKQVDIMKKIYPALRFPAVLPEGVFNLQQEGKMDIRIFVIAASVMFLVYILLKKFIKK